MNSANFPEFSNERKTAYKSILRRSIEDALLQFLGLIPSRAIDDPIRTSVLGVYAGAPNPNTIVHLYHLTRASHDRSQLIEDPPFDGRNAGHDEDRKIVDDWRQRVQDIIVWRLEIDTIYMSKGLSRAIHEYVCDSSDTHLESLLRWFPYGQSRAEIDAMESVQATFENSYDRAKRHIGANPCVVLGIAAASAPDAATGVQVTLESGLSVWHPASGKVSDHHLALKNTWVRERKTSTHTFQPTVFTLGVTQEHTKAADLDQGLHQLIQTTTKQAQREGMSVVLAVYDWGSLKQEITRWGPPSQAVEILDVAEIWRCLENRGWGYVSSISTALKWASPRSGRLHSRNCGDEARMIVDLLHALLSFDSAKDARWHIFGAHTVTQIPNVVTIERPGRPSLDII